MDKRTAVCSHNGELPNNEQQWTIDTWKDVTNQSQMHFAKWKKRGPKGYIWNASTYMAL